MGDGDGRRIPLSPGEMTQNVRRTSTLKTKWGGSWQIHSFGSPYVLELKAKICGFSSTLMIFILQKPFALIWTIWRDALISPSISLVCVHVSVSRRTKCFAWQPSGSSLSSAIPCPWPPSHWPLSWWPCWGQLPGVEGFVMVMQSKVHGVCRKGRKGFIFKGKLPFIATLVPFS